MVTIFLVIIDRSYRLHVGSLVEAYLVMRIEVRMFRGAFVGRIPESTKDGRLRAGCAVCGMRRIWNTLRKLREVILEYAESECRS